MAEFHKRYENGIRTNDSLTCPQCGAPIEDEKCPYCGVVFYDFACCDTRRPFFLKIKRDDQIHIFKVQMAECTVKYEPNETQLWSDDRIFEVVRRPDIDIDMHFHVVE